MQNERSLFADRQITKTIEEELTGSDIDERSAKLADLGCAKGGIGVARDDEAHVELRRKRNIQSTM